MKVLGFTPTKDLCFSLRLRVSALNHGFLFNFVPLKEKFFGYTGKACQPYPLA